MIALQAAYVSASARDALYDVLSQVVALVNRHRIVPFEPFVGVAGLAGEAVVPAVLVLTFLKSCFCRRHCAVSFAVEFNYD